MELVKLIISDTLIFVGRAILGGVFVFASFFVKFVSDNHNDFQVSQWFTYPLYLVLLVMISYFVGKGITEKHNK